MKPFKRKEKDHHRFPLCISEDQADAFCLPFKCPEQLPQPSFPSPNSSFSPERLKEIMECIERANDLLLALGLDRDPDNTRSLQLALRELRGSQVNVTFICNEKNEEATGYILDAGLNFIVLETQVQNIMFILFERLVSVKLLDTGRFQGKESQELIGIDQCLRRALTLHFSSVVTKSPYLLNLFYGINLNVLLVSYIDCFTYVKTDDDEREVEGVLKKVEENKVILNVDDERQGIDFDEVCYLEIEQQALVKKFNKTF